MNHRHALWLVGPVLLGVAAQLLWGARNSSLGRGPPPVPCTRWVQVGRRDSGLLCLDRRPGTRLRRAGVSRDCLRRFPPRRLRSGDRLVSPGSATCRRGRVNAGVVATLGIAVDLNRADRRELATLPGIGSGLAGRILTHRRRKGPFERAEDLLEVRGVGPRLLARLRPRLRVSVDP